MSKEAKARIKINKLLEEAGWRFLADEHGPANITLETGVSVMPEYMAEQYGDDFEKTKKGFIDYLLVDGDGYPVALLEAKRESIHLPAEQENISALRHFFKAYVGDQDVREIIHQKAFQRLANHPALSMEEFKALSPGRRTLVPDHVDTYVPLDVYAA
ncbi:MAG: hypothetical protein J5I62_06125 [Flavobacteriales bacterium]|nr:hypothetical protein [Flavobacteriales bacterium]MEB2341186.1 hypothetical protein [Flavobacteriia bacterium]